MGFKKCLDFHTRCLKTLSKTQKTRKQPEKKYNKYYREIDKKNIKMFRQIKKFLPYHCYYRNLKNR